MRYRVVLVNLNEPERTVAVSDSMTTRRDAQMVLNRFRKADWTDRDRGDVYTIGDVCLSIRTEVES